MQKFNHVFVVLRLVLQLDQLSLARNDGHKKNQKLNAQLHAVS